MTAPTGRPPGRPKGSKSKIGVELREAARKYTKKALNTLIDLAENAESEAVQLGAVCALLDRGHGKPAQAITGEGGEGPVVIRVVTGFARDEPTLIEGSAAPERIENSSV